MIVVAIVGMVIIFLAIATGITYFADRDDISQQGEESSQKINERVKESLTATYRLGSHTLEVKNAAGIETTIVSLMVKCNDGESHSQDIEVQTVNELVPPHEIDCIQSTMCEIQEKCTEQSFNCEDIPPSAGVC